MARSGGDKTFERGVKAAMPVAKRVGSARGYLPYFFPSTPESGIRNGKKSAELQRLKKVKITLPKVGRDDADA